MLETTLNVLHILVHVKVPTALLSLYPHLQMRKMKPLNWPKVIQLVSCKLEFEARQSGSINSDLITIIPIVLKIIIMVMIESKICITYCYWQGEDVT